MIMYIYIYDNIYMGIYTDIYIYNLYWHIYHILSMIYNVDMYRSYIVYDIIFILCISICHLICIL